MATIIKRGEKYLVQIRRKGMPTTCRSFHAKVDAEQWARHMEIKADRGDLPTPVKVLAGYRVRDIIERYRDEITFQKRSANTEIFILNAFLRNPMAEFTLAHITPAHFSAYRDKRLKTVKAGTVNRELGIIKHAFDIANREWDIPLRQNPLEKIKKLKVNNARSRRLNDDEYQTLMNAIETTRNDLIKPLIHFAIETGMRRGEILRLCWHDIDYDNRTLFIPVTKNGHSRTIPLTTGAIKILQERQSQHDADNHKPFPMSDNAAKLAWQRLLKRSGIDDLHFHDFRHEIADIPTLLTFLGCLKYRSPMQVVLVVIVATIFGEILSAMFQPTYEIFSFVLYRLLAQSIAGYLFYKLVKFVQSKIKLKPKKDLAG
jgi:integrase